MRINISIVFITLISIGAFGQNKSVLIQSHLNAKTGLPIEKANVVIDKVGSCFTTTDGKCFYPTLKVIGTNISIKVQHEKYVPINTLEFKSYRLSNQKIDTVKVIMSLIAEREKYALSYFETETGIIIRKRFEQKEKSLYAQINDLVASMKDIKDKNYLAYQRLEKNLEEANKRLELVQKDKLKEESIAQRLATTLSMLEGEEIPDYVSQAYSLFRQGNVEGADKALNGNAIDDQIVQAKLKKKLAKLLDESSDRQLKAAIAACLFKAQLKSNLYEFKQAEIWFRKAYQADTSNVNTLFTYASFLAEHEDVELSLNYYKRALKVFEDFSIQSPEVYLPLCAIVLNNIGVIYSKNKSIKEALKSHENALNIYQSLSEKYPDFFYSNIVYTRINLSLIYLDYGLGLKKDFVENTELTLSLLKKLLDTNDRKEEYLSLYINSIHNLSMFYSREGESEKALSLVRVALSINDSLAKNNPQKYLPFLANSLNIIGTIYEQKNDIDGSGQEYFIREVEIYKDLASRNPLKFLPNLAIALSNLGTSYQKKSLMEKALLVLEEALQIKRALVKINRVKYQESIAVTLNTLGITYRENGLIQKSLQCFEEALNIYESLNSNSEETLYQNGILLNNLIKVYAEQRLNDKLIQCLERSLEVYELLTLKNSDKYLTKMDDILVKLELAYRAFNIIKPAEKTFKQALQLYETLAKVDSIQYLPYVAKALVSLKDFYTDNNLTDLAEQSYERILQVYEILSIADPKQHLSGMAMTQINYSLFWTKKNKLEKVEYFKVKGLKSYQLAAQLLNDDIFWGEAKTIRDDLLQIISFDTLYQHKLNLVQAVIDFNSQFPLATKKEKVSALGNGAWYALCCKEYKLAEEYAIKGLDIAQEQLWLYRNLALALLLQNRWAEAIKIYQEKQNLVDNNDKPLRESFLNDMLELEKAGIKHTDFVKVKELLR